jgi:hypothetical protein
MSRNASPNTNAKMSGSLLSRLVLKSSDPAASPVTLTLAPSTFPTVAGTMSSRSLLRASKDAWSFPLPIVGMLIWATVSSSLSISSVPFLKYFGFRSTASTRAAIPAVGPPAFTSSTSITTVAVVPSCGKTSFTLL